MRLASDVLDARRFQTAFELVILCFLLSSCQRPVACDLIICNAMMDDSSGDTLYKGNIAVSGNSIVAVATQHPVRAKEELDALSKHNIFDTLV